MEEADGWIAWEAEERAVSYIAAHFLLFSRRCSEELHPEIRAQRAPMGRMISLCSREGGTRPLGFSLLCNYLIPTQSTYPPFGCRA